MDRSIRLAAIILITLLVIAFLLVAVLVKVDVEKPSPKPTLLGGPNGRPISGVNYSAEHTVPIAIKAAMPTVVADLQVDSSWLHSFKRGTGASKVNTEFPDEQFKFVHRIGVTNDDEGNFIHKTTGASVVIWKIYCSGANRDRKLHHVYCSSGIESASYEVTLLASPST